MSVIRRGRAGRHTFSGPRAWLYPQCRRTKGVVMGLFRFLARVTIGLLFVGHGTQKLFGWFGGSGPEGTGRFFEQVGLRPGRRSALAAGAAEAGGGLLFALGAATPLAAAAVS